MEPKQLIEHFRQGFGETPELPLAFWYSDTPAAQPGKCPRCYIAGLRMTARNGGILSLNAENMLCGGGKLYAGFAPPRPGLEEFVSYKELYKKDDRLVADFIADFAGAEKAGQWINFARIDCIESFDGIEGVVFFATPDVLSGLLSWCFFDTNDPDAVTVPFGSGCSSIVAQVVRENKTGGKRTFLGMFDPSARPCVGENELTYAIPAGRFREMCGTMAETFLVKTTADWEKIKHRINR